MWDEFDYYFDREPSSGSGGDEDPYNYHYYKYVIDLSDKNNLCITSTIYWYPTGSEEYNGYLDSVKFELQPKGGVISDNELTKLAQERIITPALTEEVY